MVMFMAGCSQKVTLDIQSNALVPDLAFETVFQFDKTDPIPAPSANREKFDLEIRIDGQKTGFEFTELGGAWHGASTTLAKGNLISFNFATNTDALDKIFAKMMLIKFDLFKYGFEPTDNPNVSNKPDLDLTLNSANSYESLAADAELVSQVMTALDDMPVNLSKLGLTLFNVERANILIKCDLIRQFHIDDAPDELNNYPVRAECSIGKSGSLLDVERGR